MGRAAPTRSASRNRLPLAYAFLSLFFALVQLRLYTTLLPRGLQRSIDVTEAIVHGQAAGMVVSFLCFGEIYESRVLMPLIPFVALNGRLAVDTPRVPPSAATRRA